MNRRISYLIDICFVATALFWVFNIVSQTHPAILNFLYACPIIIDALLIICFCVKLYLGIATVRDDAGRWNETIFLKISARTIFLLGIGIIILAFIWLEATLPQLRNDANELFLFAIVPVLLLIVIGTAFIGIALYSRLFRVDDRR